MKRYIYRNKKGRFISKRQFFDKEGRKRYPSYKKQLVEYQEAVYVPAPEVETKKMSLSARRADLSRRINEKIKSLIPFDGIFEKAEFDVSKIKDYSIVGRYVLYDVESYYKGRIHYTGRSKAAKKQAAIVKRLVYEARLKGYMATLSIDRTKAQAIYKIVQDSAHPQHSKIMEKIYGVRKPKTGIIRIRADRVF